MIQSLEITNVCRVPHEVIEFRALQRIVGENQAGKSSAIFDPLRIVLLGETFPETMIRHGQTEAKAKVTFADGRWIERARTGKAQRCTLCDADGKQTEYTTIKDIREITQKFTGFSEIVLDKNVGPESFQFFAIDDPQTYLVSGVDPKGVLSRITKIIGGTGPETAKKTLESSAKELKSARRVHSEQLEFASKRVEEVWAQIDSEELNALLAKHISARKKVDTLAAKLVDLREELEQEREIASLLENVAKVYDPANVQQLYEKYAQLDSEIAEKGAAKMLGIEYIEVYHMLNSGIKSADLAPLQNAQQALDDKIEVWQETCNLFSNHDKLRRELEQHEAELRHVESDMIVAKKSAQTCPTCGQPVPGKAVA